MFHFYPHWRSLLVILLLVFSVLPTALQGQDYYAIPGYNVPTRIDALLFQIKDLANTIIGILFVIATLVFLWGVIQFIAKSGDEAARNKAKAIMTWGIIGLAVMAAVWGIVTLIVNYFIPGSPTDPTRLRIPTKPGDIQ